MEIKSTTNYFSSKREVTVDPRDDEIEREMNVCLDTVVRNVRDHYGFMPIEVVITYHAFPVTHEGQQYVGVSAYVNELKP